VRAALLTGATGFLGAHLASDLLTHTSLELCCLVRASNDDDARMKLRDALQAQQLWRDDFDARIRPFAGDLSSGRMGLTESTLLRLGEEVDVIYHSAARTTLIFPYRALRAVNVGGTRELLRFAAMSPPKAFHHVSSLAVFGALRSTQPSDPQEEFRVSRPPPRSSGYAQSKWVAERLVNAAAKRGLQVAVYRPGRITGHSETGACSGDDSFSLMVQACIRLGIAPEIEGAIHLTPVDCVSRAIVELSRAEDSIGKAFHLINPAAVRWLDVLETLRVLRYVDRVTSLDEWRSRVSALAHSDRGGCFERLAVLLSNRQPFRQVARKVADANTSAGLAAVTRVNYPVEYGPLLTRYFRYLASGHGRASGCAVTGPW
jgi:myxalamid-type nonribosomal peptide synthetase MxaA